VRWGWFVCRGFERDAGAGHGSAYVMFQHDSVSGNSVGYLVEGGIGPASVGHESEVNVNSGKVDSDNYVFLGLSDHLGVFAGAGSDTAQAVIFGGGYCRAI
jgi:hypothetical protein